MEKLKNFGLIVASIIIAILLMALSSVVAVLGFLGFTAAFIYYGRKLWIEGKAELAQIKLAEEAKVETDG
jgi:predicted tellurium resistance membrane protein TerC